jgi:hypothetical protein
MNVCWQQQVFIDYFVMDCRAVNHTGRQQQSKHRGAKWRRVTSHEGTVNESTVVDPVFEIKNWHIATEMYFLLEQHKKSEKALDF